MNVARDRIKIGASGEGIERLEAMLHGNAFSPHRHDSYAIGITVAGVQTFRFRGAKWHCLPGQCHILHPDELHDGGAGTDEPFGYRMLYIDPSLVQQALRGQPLPFVPNPVLDPTGLLDGEGSELWDINGKVDEITRTELSVLVANLLVGAAPGGTRAGVRSLDIKALLRVREFIAAYPSQIHSMKELEVLAGLDRWTIARQFRAAFGTSPSRFRTQRQLDHVRDLIRGGSSLVDASIKAGFADQSHMSRQFKSTYGLTPAKWASAIL
ncbi:AraC-like DNA-binding protein [Rhodanobacter sp. ANJX3]|uniref:AraC family transcriptional regulator n=1 Tax=unclassified Rhodanobacter TaxID=2621553 RepID=UPI0015C9F4B6|nr:MULTISPECIES: AraC family transcriptional regulator [unclassified Rhodanobacter]MBB5360043.1 AraC-like DNA-binding protein [Rhodanobacter sp. ANJX3]NYE28971.1 AraC-like DNA-binding protein [Rhodanobacter sp. K2T2]